MRGSIWSILGVKQTRDEAEIRRAYARRLKEVHPEDDPEGFQALRAAYESALSAARRGQGSPGPRLSAPSGPVRVVAAAEATADRDGGDAGDDAAWADPVEREWGRAPETPALPPEEQARRDAEAAAEQAHVARLQALWRTLQEQPAPSAERVVTDLLVILRSPEMGNIARHERTEIWLAELILGGAPATEALVEPAIHYFGWASQRISTGRDNAGPSIGQQVLSALERRREVERVIRDRSEHSGAYRVLSRKPGWRMTLAAALTPGLGKEVAAFLDGPAWRLPELRARLDPAAVDWWTARLEAPRLPALAIWSLVALPLLAALIGTVSGEFGAPDWGVFGALWVVALTSLAGGCAAWMYGLALPRRRWIDGEPWRAPAWLRLGWAPLTAGFLLLSGVLPVNLPWVVAYWLLLGPLVLWTKVVNAHFDESRSGLRGGALAALPLFAWLVAHAHGAVFVSLCWAAGGATVVAHYGRPALEEAWLSLGDARRRLIAAGLAVAAVAAGAAVCFAPDWPTRAMAAAVVALLVLAARPIRFVQAPVAATLWIRWMTFGWMVCMFVAIAVAPDQIMALTTFKGFGVWLAGGALLTYVWEAAPRLEALLARRRRKPGALA